MENAGFRLLENHLLEGVHARGGARENDSEHGLGYEEGLPGGCDPVNIDIFGSAHWCNFQRQVLPVLVLRTLQLGKQYFPPALLYRRTPF